MWRSPRSVISIHWLAQKYKIEYKMLLLCYNPWMVLSHHILTVLLDLNAPHWILYRHYREILVIAVSVISSTLWNNLPESLSHSFNSTFKTHLFKLTTWSVVYYWPLILSSQFIFVRYIYKKPFSRNTIRI
jgi:hypothetical protein